MRAFLLFLVFVVSASAQAQLDSLTTDEKLADFNTLVARIEASYGPLKHKIRHEIIDWKKLKKEYRSQIPETQNNAEYYYLLVRFVDEFQDGHFSVEVPSNYRARVPLAAELVDGEVLVAQSFKGQDTSNRTYSLSRGDKIVSINGRPVGEVLDELQKYFTSGYHLAERKFAVWLLFFRPASILPVPQGEITVEVQKADSQNIKTLTLSWRHQGQGIDEQPGFNMAQKRGQSPAHPGKLSMEDVLDRLPSRHVERSYMCSGSSRIKRPEDATVIMEKPFVAYYYPTKKGNIGYLRIPHYIPRNSRGRAAYDKRFRQYEYAVKKLEKHTQGLIIDQDHNCGGSAGYLNRLLGLFVESPFKTSPFRWRANKKSYMQAKKWRDRASKNTIEKEEANHFLGVIKSSWLNGDFMTPKMPLSLGRFTSESPVRYTKPIIVLIDRFSGSGGDMFPAMMKGLGRADLLGTQTSGLGGSVMGQAPLPFSRMKVRMTVSLFYKPSGQPVENNGAKPDIPYTITKKDFVSGYVPYRKFYTQKILEKIDSSE